VGLQVIGLSTMTTLWQYYSFYLLMALGYMCGGPLPNQVLTSRWFNKSAGESDGQLLTWVLGLAECWCQHIAKWLNMQMDWRSSLVVLGLFMIAIAFPMAWFVRDNPEGKLKEAKADEPKIPFKTILKSRSFYLLGHRKYVFHWSGGRGKSKPQTIFQP
jgi:sugar phosphate permease